MSPIPTLPALARVLARPHLPDETLARLAPALIYPPEEAAHLLRVTKAFLQLARAVELTAPLPALRNGALLHDVGKILLCDESLHNGHLSRRQLHRFRCHPWWGAEIARALAPHRLTLSLVRHHHERWDGRGYPDRLQGWQTPAEVRLFRVLDAWDSMTYPRPYRPHPRSRRQARRELLTHAGTQWDPWAVDLFLAWEASSR